MFVKIHAQEPLESDAIHEYVDSKIRLALGIYGYKILRADIFLAGMNDSTVDKDKRCTIKVNVQGSSPAVAHYRSDNLYEAIDFCTRIVKRSVDRHFKRHLHDQRGAANRHQLH